MSLQKIQSQHHADKIAFPFYKKKTQYKDSLVYTIEEHCSLVEPRGYLIRNVKIFTGKMYMYI